MCCNSLIKASMQSKTDNLEDFITDSAPVIDNESLSGDNLNGIKYL